MPRLFFFSAFLLANSLAIAGKPSLPKIPPETSFVLHLDVTQMSQAAACREIGQKLWRESIVQSRVQQLPANVRFLLDARWTGVTQITLEGESSLIARGTFDRSKIMALLTRAQGYAAVTHNKRRVHHWIQLSNEILPGFGDGKKTKETATAFLTFVDDRTIIYSNRMRPLLKTIDVLDGRRPAMKPEKLASLESLLTEKTFIMGASWATGLKADPVIPVSFAFVVGSDGDRVTVDTDVEANSATVAASMLLLAKGALKQALARKKPQTKVAPDDDKNILSVTWSWTSKDKPEDVQKKIDRSLKFAINDSHLRINWKGHLQCNVKVRNPKFNTSSIEFVLSNQRRKVEITSRKTKSIR